MNDKLGLLVMHYGTPSSMDAILPYYTHIRRGRPPSQEQLADLTARYAAIGGPSPLTSISERQGSRVQEGLKRRGMDAQLYIGTKHAPPFIADAVRQMQADGVVRAVGLVLAPHYSSFSVAAYRRYAMEAIDGPLQLSFVERWGTLPSLIEALAERVRSQLRGWDPAQTLVVFTAHSLPEKIVAAGDPYKNELLETSRLVAERSGVPNWTFAFQSASDTGEPWLGPDVTEVVEQRAHEFKNVIACTVGFVSDHLEVLYDLGIELRQKCEELDLNFRRADTINDDPAVMDALAELCARELER